MLGTKLFGDQAEQASLSSFSTMDDIVPISDPFIAEWPMCFLERNQIQWLRTQPKLKEIPSVSAQSTAVPAKDIDP